MKDAKRNAQYGPVGAVIYNAYWQEHYTVLSHNSDDTVSVAWHGDARYSNPTPPRTTTHCTPLDRRDRMVGWGTLATIVETHGERVEVGDRLHKSCTWACTGTQVARGCVVHNRHDLPVGAQVHVCPAVAKDAADAA